MRISDALLEAMASSVRRYEDLNTSPDARRSVVSELREYGLRTRENLRPRGTLTVSAEASIGGELSEALRTAVLLESDGEARSLIAGALGDLGGAAHIDALSFVLSNDYEDQEDAAFAAAAALGEIGGEPVAQILATFARNSKNTNRRLAVLTALDRLATKERLPEPDFGVKMAPVIQELMALASDFEADPFLRMRADDILTSLGSALPVKAKQPFLAGERRRFE